MNKILVTTSTFAVEETLPVDMLRDAGYEVVLNPFGRKLTEDEVVKLILDMQPAAMIAGVESLTARVLEQAGNMKAICRCGMGIDTVDLAAAERCGIKVMNTPDAPTRAVAELTIGLIIDLLRRISQLDREIRKQNWKKVNGSLVQGRTVGIVGLGRIGKTVAGLLLSLGADVSGTDINPDNAWLQSRGISLVSLDQLLKENDVIVLNLSYTPENRHLIDKRKIGIMKKGAYLVNPSRGEVVDEEALFEALTNGHLSGAAIDVFSQEPYTGPLTTLDNVVLTPHIGSYARESRIEMERQAAENILRCIGACKDGAQPDASK